MKEERKCMLIVISGPSGVGKGTIFSRLLASDPSLTFSVSATTRAPRNGETDGVDYFFITEDQYQELVQQDAFLEHATVHGHSYGTLKSQIMEKLDKGLNVVLDIDPQGNTTRGLGIAKRGLKYTSYDLFVGEELNAANTIIHTNFKNLDIIPASVDLAGAEIELVKIQGVLKEDKEA